MLPLTRPASFRLYPRFSPRFLALAYRALVGLAIFHLVAQFVVWFPLEMARTDHYRDIAVYFDAIQRLHHGQSAYVPWPDYGVQMTPSHFFYSPIFLLFTRPLAGLSYMQFAHVWLVLVFCAFWTYCFCLSRLATGKWDWKAALLFGLVIDTLVEGYTALCLGQFEPFMWVLFGLALTTRKRAGWLSLATLIKIHPIWALALVLSEGKAKEWRNALLFAVPVVLLSCWVAGFHSWTMWWPAARPVASQGTFHFGNWSLSFFGLRVLSWCGLLHPYGTLPIWAKAYLSLCAVGGPLATAYFARKQSPNLRLALVASAGALFAPLCWGFYYPLFFLPLAVWLGERRGTQEGALKADGSAY